MDLDNILNELRSEVSRLNQAILSIEKLKESIVKRRGRPPKGLPTNAAAAAPVSPPSSPKRARDPEG